MNSIEFLTKKLRELHKICSYLDIKYEHKNYLNTHVIDVRPRNYFENDEIYISEQFSLEDEFENLFPMEEIVFITESELVSINNPILELQSTSINEFNVICEEPVIGELFKQDLVEGHSKNYYQCLYGFEDYLITKSGIANRFELPNKEKQKPPSKKWFNKSKSKGSKATSEPFFV